MGDPFIPRVMGVINVSRESFYKGSVVQNIDDALGKAQLMVEEGANFIDVGAMSTAPTSPPISAIDEEERIIPVIKALAENIDCPISVDTFRARIARAALEKGARIINDVSGLVGDPDMAGAVKDFDCPAVVMASEKTMGDALTIQDIVDALRVSLKKLESIGHGTDGVIADPGIGLWIPGKTYEYNLQIIDRLASLKILQKPILVGISRKSFIGHVLGKEDPSNRLEGTLAATAIAVYNGAHIIRTHDVGRTMDTIKTARYIAGNRRENNDHIKENYDINGILP